MLSWATPNFTASYVQIQYYTGQEYSSIASLTIKCILNITIQQFHMQETIHLHLIVIAGQY